MPKPLALSNGTILQRSAGGFMRRSAQAAAQGQLVVSYYGLRQDPYIDLAAHNIRSQYGAVSVSRDDWRATDLWQEDYIDVDGTMLSAPAGLTSFTSNEILYHAFKQNPSYYEGRTLVMEGRQGKFKGTGNSFGISFLGAVSSDTTWHEEQNASGDGATTTFTFSNAAGWSADQIHVYVGGYRKQHKMKAGEDYTVADNGSDLDVTFTSAPASGVDNIYFLLARREWVIDTTNWGSNAPREAGPFPSYSVGTPSAIQDWMPHSIFWKDEEADFRARFDQPRKMIAPWLRSNLEPFHVVRQMDGFMDPMRSGACYPADMCELDDVSIGNHAASPQGDFDYTLNGGVGIRQMNTILPVLDLCKNEYASVRTPWLIIPIFMGLPVYPGVLSEGIQTSGSSQLGFIWFNPHEVDLNETITLSDEKIDGSPVSGVASLDLANKRIQFDPAGNFTHTDNDPNVHYSVTINYTDVNSGAARSYILDMRVMHFNSAGPGYIWWHGTGEAWQDNESHFDNHWSWEAWADWILDQLVAAGWSSTDEVLIEVGNEIWNSANPFSWASSMGSGCGNVKSNDGNRHAYGGGWITAKLKKHLDDRMTARSLSYNMTMALGLWTANGSHFATWKLNGYKGYWASAEGGSLTGSALDAKVAEAQLFITNYYSNPLKNNRTQNYTGLEDVSQTFDGDGAKTVFTVNDGAGATASQCTVTVDSVAQTPGTDFTVADNGSNLDVTFASAPANGSDNVEISHNAHTEKVETDYTADEAAFWLDDIYGYYADQTKDELTTIYWIEQRYDEIQAVAESFGTKVRGAYEGGSHDDAVPGSIKNDITGFASSYETEMYGPGTTGADIWDLMVQRLRAKDPEFMIAAYGGFYATDIDGSEGNPDFGQPWQFGQYQKAKNNYLQAIIDAGISS